MNHQFYSAHTKHDVYNENTICIVNCGQSCELSAFNIGRVLKFLQKNNYTIIDDIHLADVLLINSCCVISGKRNQVKSVLEKALSAAHIQMIVLFGCFAGIQAETIQKIIRIPSKQIERMDDHFAHHISIRNIEQHVLHRESFLPYQASFDPGLRHVLISQGCVNRCSYCNIKFAKGEVQSRSPDTILGDIKKLLCDGKDECMLLADDCGSYGLDINTNIVSLCQKILAFDSRIKLRIHYLFPRVLIDFARDFLDLFSTGRITYVNFPIQSGSQRLLQLMNRNYDIVQVLHLVSRIKGISPQTWLYTHMIVNFPTETDTDLQTSLRAATFFDEVLFMNYSKNPLTPAFHLPDVDLQHKQRTLQTVSAYLQAGAKGLLIDAESGDPW